MPEPRDTYSAPDRAGTDRLPSAADRLAIEELFARYAWAVDTGDTAGVDALFMPDAVIEDTVVPRVFGPPSAGRDFAEYFRNRPVFPGRQHWVGQAVMTMLDDDTCAVRSFGMATHLYATGANFITYLGSYDDLVVRDGQAWRFRGRRYFSWTRDTFDGFVGTLPEIGA